MSMEDSTLEERLWRAQRGMTRRESQLVQIRELLQKQYQEPVSMESFLEQLDSILAIPSAF
jgi:hypothetical protein